MYGGGESQLIELMILLVQELSIDASYTSTGVLMNHDKPQAHCTSFNSNNFVVLKTLLQMQIQIDLNESQK